MSCEEHGDVIVCSPSRVAFRKVRECPTCKRRRRFVVDAFVWYPSIWTCCGCGDAWSEGERMRRPASRGWRESASRKARAEWAAIDNEQADAALRAMIREAVEP